MTPANLARGGTELWATLTKVMGRTERARSPGAA